MTILLTERAAEKIKGLLRSRHVDGGAALRVGVKEGGWVGVR
jgi:Fe-S cluster assembly iron-binding protein IscA